MKSNTAQYDTDEWGDKESRSKPKHKNKHRGSRDSKRTNESPED
ncbi:hypothetical protein C8K58_11444 [Pseudomonas sp. GV047]|nr:hypothetical protein C8K58_11444 [Pseudomonas sp. GV047]